MKAIEIIQRLVRVAILGAAVCLVMSASVQAEDGSVLPAWATPKGYSLTDLAALTGEFNSGPRDGVPPTELTPFTLLYRDPDAPPDEVTEFWVDPRTMLYVPVVYSFGDSVDVNSKAALAYLYFSPDQYGAEYIEIVVDGEVTSLQRYGYPVGAEIPLEDGSTLEYSTVAAILTPLRRGTHTVAIRALFDGALLGGGTFEFENVYTVIVE